MAARSAATHIFGFDLSYLLRCYNSQEYSQVAILIIKIGFLKARRWRAFKKPILVFSVPLALKTLKSVS
ncbi:hypothetical protein [Pseudanabaena minima]|uniref:hypothetical protein n=1 Tax=Pseudanabaena minima TaxID=890415 RepID=UPI003DA921EB